MAVVTADEESLQRISSDEGPPPPPNATGGTATSVLQAARRKEWPRLLELLDGSLRARARLRKLPRDEMPLVERKAVEATEPGE